MRQMVKTERHSGEWSEELTASERTDTKSEDLGTTSAQRIGPRRAGRHEVARFKRTDRFWTGARSEGQATRRQGLAMQGSARERTKAEWTSGGNVSATVSLGPALRLGWSPPTECGHQKHDKLAPYVTSCHKFQRFGQMPMTSIKGHSSCPPLGMGHIRERIAATRNIGYRWVLRPMDLSKKMKAVRIVNRHCLLGLAPGAACVRSETGVPSPRGMVRTERRTRCGAAVVTRCGDDASGPPGRPGSSESL